MKKIKYRLAPVEIKDLKDWKGERIEITKEDILKLYGLIKRDEDILGVNFPIDKIKI